MSAGGKIDLRDLSTHKAPPGTLLGSDGVRWKPVSSGSVLSLSFFRDRFALTTSGAQALALTHTPAPYSAHVYRNGVYRDEGTDYTITGSTLSVLTAMSAASGDVIEARYAIGSAASALTGYAGAVVTDGPAWYLRLGEASGTVAADSSGNGHDGTYSGSPTLGATGLLVGDTDTCVTFDGVNDVVSIAYGSYMNAANVTVEAIVQSTSSGTGAHNIIDRDDVSGRVFQFRLSNTGKIEFILIGGSVVTATSSASVNDGLPHHVAATYDGTTIRVYIDGVADGTAATAGPLPSGSSGVAMLVGANASSGIGQFWAGQIDEAAYWTSALTAGQIAAHFTASGL